MAALSPDALSTGTQDVREHAAAVLGFAGDARAAPFLAAALADADADVRHAALVALGQLRGELADAAITGATGSLDARIRTLATRLTADRTPVVDGQKVDTDTGELIG